MTAIISFMPVSDWKYVAIQVSVSESPIQTDKLRLDIDDSVGKFIRDVLINNSNKKRKKEEKEKKEDVNSCMRCANGR